MLKFGTIEKHSKPINQRQLPPNQLIQLIPDISQYILIADENGISIGYIRKYDIWTCVQLVVRLQHIHNHITALGKQNRQVMMLMMLTTRKPEIQDWTHGYKLKIHNHQF